MFNGLTQCTFAYNPPPPPPPPVIRIYDVHVYKLSSDSVQVSWKTNYPTTSQIIYGTSPYYTATTQKSYSRVTQHNRSLSSLQPYIEYHFTILVEDSTQTTWTAGDYSFRVTASGTVIVFFVDTAIGNDA
ncbi:MAG: hypothetical protein QME64_11295, partial [bacterium]|nr:hypothetical protein [bacterium]